MLVSGFLVDIRYCSSKYRSIVALLNVDLLERTEVLEALGVPGNAGGNKTGFVNFRDGESSISKMATSVPLCLQKQFEQSKMAYKGTFL